jgi:putative DNA primase/helicase
MTDEQRGALLARLKWAQALQTWAIRSESAPRINAMIQLAQSEQPVPLRYESLDADPWLFNCPNGTLDLRAGELRAHRREDYLTKLCPTLYKKGAACPAWERALRAIFANKQHLVEYFRRMCGYCLTGDVSEQILPVFWGTGSNGKSLIFELVRSVMGADYAGTGARELIRGRDSSHPTYIADLFGMRLVTLAETREGGGINETLIKELTGGENLKARRMREDFWSFTPTHKLWLATNHKPAVRGTDHGIWRRLRLLPFEVKFWDEDKGESGPLELRADKHLKVRLLAEAEGVLAWMVRGCQEWQAGGMREPKEVTLATAEYRAEQNIVGRFISDRCEVGPDKTARAGELYAAYRKWHDTTGEDGKPIGQRKFGEGMSELGYQRRTSNGIVYDGLALRQDKDG